MAMVPCVLVTTRALGQGTARATPWTAATGDTSERAGLSVSRRRRLSDKKPGLPSLRCCGDACRAHVRRPPHANGFERSGRSFGIVVSCIRIILAIGSGMTESGEDARGFAEGRGDAGARARGQSVWLPTTHRTTHSTTHSAW